MCGSRSRLEIKDTHTHGHEQQTESVMYNILFGGRRKKFEVNCAETTYKVHYLGNVMTSLLKGGQADAVSRRGGGCNVSGGGGKKGIGEQTTSVKEIVVECGEVDDDLDEDYLERLSDEVALSCVDKPVRILWDNHLKNSGNIQLR